MTDYLRCPAPCCSHHIGISTTREAAAEVMTDHLIEAHDMPEVSASYEAQLLLPITGPKAA